MVERINDCNEKNCIITIIVNSKKAEYLITSPFFVPNFQEQLFFRYSITDAPAFRYNLFFFKEKKKRIFTLIGARNGEWLFHKDSQRKKHKDSQIFKSISAILLLRVPIAIGTRKGFSLQ